MSLIRLVYVSSAHNDWLADNLLSLLKTCRTNNSAGDITGTLLYENRTFFQVLEGERNTIEQLFEKIKRDKRHKDVTLIEKKPIGERQFPYWSMGSQKLSSLDLKNVEGMEDFFQHDFTPEGFLHHKEVVPPLMKLIRDKLENQVVAADTHEELPEEHDDPLIQFLHRTIRLAVKMLAVLMVFVIIAGVFDVLYVIYQKMASPPSFVLTINDMLATFGAFLAVLIAIEIFLNITLYIRSDVIPVKLVVATALMAISRKVIVFDFKNLSPDYVVSSALVVLALGITYWLIRDKG